ncbi:hypothetical protein IAT40_003408 [Kwoniella sp. CBS 6097]
MSLPHNGSTAPVVTSPLIAWPARPSTRSSPMSTPSSETFDNASPSYPSRGASSSSATAFSDGRWSSPKGKERAFEPPQVRVDEHDDEEERERHYGPPKKPLNPHQLGRIAQSFGVIIPHLPQQPTPISPTIQQPLSPASSSSQTAIPIPKGRLSPLLGSQAPTRPSPFLLSVIPPLSLLPPTSAATPEQAHKRAKKWRRGRLLPLQPTLGSMLVCIAREYGLPSTVGLGVYLVLPGGLSRGDAGSSSSAGSSYSSEGDEPSGPLISSSTWSTLFAPHLVQAASTSLASRCSTPSHTPVKGTAGHLDADAPYPPSPLSMALKSSHSQPSSLGRRPKIRSLSTEPLTKPPVISHSSHPSTSSSAAILPPTPASLGTSYASAPSPNPIVGTIEFDIDMDEATWFEDWRKSGGMSRHKRTMTTTASEGARGMKELELVNKAADERPRFLKDLDVNRPTPERRRLSVEAHSHQVVSASASFSEFSDDVALNDEEKMEQRRGSEGMLAVDDIKAKDLLASPIELELGDEAESQGPLDATTTLQVQEILDKRGSGLIMADQLDDLEKIMRQLSPREIRLTSPRLLTPRMAAKVANLALPAVPRRNVAKPAPSPLAGGFVSPNPNNTDFDRDADIESSVPNSATGSTHTFGSTLTHDQDPAHPRADDEDAKAISSGAEYEPPKPSWPAVPHGAESPGSPCSIQEFFVRPALSQQRNVSSPAAISNETMQRMQSEKPTTKPPAASEWVPRRPARPPSPKLEHQRTLSHTLSPELVDFLHRSPPQQSQAQIAPALVADEVISPEGPGRKTRRSGSISLKGLRHQMSARNIGHMWKNDAASSPPMPGREKETVGLFKGALDTESSSSFPGLQIHPSQGQRSISNPILGSTSSTQNDFGPPLPVPTHDSIDAPHSTSSNSLPHSSKGGRFTSKIFGFRKHDHSSSASTSTASSDREKEKRSRRQPSHDSGAGSAAGAASLNISPPIASSFVHAQTQGVRSYSFEATPESATLPQNHSAVQHQALGHGRPNHAHSPSFSNGNGNGQGSGIPPSPHIPASPNTPASPHSVRRKPVPGVGVGSADASNAVKNSMSLGSMASFVLEDPPKGRRGLGRGMGI